MENNYNELVKFLKNLGIEGITKGEKRSLLSMLDETDNLEEVKKELELLFVVNKTLISSYGKVSVGNMLSISKSINISVLFKLFVVYQKIKDKSKDEVESLRNFKKTAIEILKESQIIDEEVGEILSDSYKKSLEVKDALYLTMIDKEKADALFDNCVKRSKLFLSQCEARNLERVIYCLKNDFSLSDDELVNISKKCASFFAFSSVSKINNLNKRINEFKEFIRNQSVVMSTAREIDRLLKKEFKDVLFESSSVATLNSDSINKTIEFLMGGKLYLNKEYGEIKGNFTPYQLAKIYNESISSLGISVEKISEVAVNVADVYKKTFNRDIDLNQLINGHNFSSISQLTKEVYLSSEDLKEKFEILSMFITAEDMENLLRNNLSFLIAPVGAIKSSLQSAVLSSSNKDELRRNVLQKIRNHFDIYEGGFQKVQRGQASIKIESLNKVGVKSIEEEEMVAVLKRLETSSSEIEAWGKRWNKEEKEYRELEIEIELEELASKIENVIDFCNIDFISEEQFVEEIMIVREIYLEVEKEYRDILEGKKLNKKLMAQSEKIERELEKARTMINNHIETIIDKYTEEMKSISGNLNRNDEKLEHARRRFQRREEVEELISEVGTSESILREVEEVIDDIEIFILDMDNVVKEITNNEKKASYLIQDFHRLLLKKSASRVFNGEDALEYTAAEILAMLMVSLEDEGLVEDPLGALSVNISVERWSYKRLRNYLDKDEAAIADMIRKNYCDNMDKKVSVRKKVKEYLDKYDIDYTGIDSSYEMFKILYAHATTLSQMVEEDKKLLKEKKFLDSENLEALIKKLEDSGEELKESIEMYVSKINSLRNVQIKR